MQPKEIETVALDQLQQLDRNRQVFVELRASMMEADQQDTREFQNQMRTAMPRLQSSVDAALANFKRNRQKAPTVNLHEDNATDELEEAERAAVQADRHPPTFACAGGHGHARIRKRRAPEKCEFLEKLGVEEGEVGEEEEEPQEVQERIRQQNVNMRKQIEGGIRQLQQARSNFLQIIDELRHLPTCPPRRYGYGAVGSDTGRFMRCAFCRADGKHYSDSCDEFPCVCAPSYD
ncbi:unnamed protein product [Haemonchus placei]|uniref:CCHC-type domain-containing protein n=1 Tax=Haemonchus placei TaxID=6290 RepID=A0A0N4W439_HAEPC|nr:unnamed protein product [Haemonchus placei]